MPGPQTPRASNIVARCRDTIRTLSKRDDVPQEVGQALCEVGQTLELATSYFQVVDPGQRPQAGVREVKTIRGRQDQDRLGTHIALRR